MIYFCQINHFILEESFCTFKEKFHLIRLLEEFYSTILNCAIYELGTASK